MDLRILEIGHYCPFKRTWPERVTWLCPRGRPGKGSVLAHSQPYLTERHLPQLEGALARGEFDLLVHLARGLPPCRPTPVDLFYWNFLPSRLFNPNRRIARRLIEQAPEIPLAVLDPHDAPQIDPQDLPLLDGCHAFFKRELPLDASALFFRRADRDRARGGIPGQVHPLPLGLSPERVAAAPTSALEKTVDIFFSGRVDFPPSRRRGIDQLLALRREGIRVEVGERMSLSEYMERCARAWLVWSPEGFGQDCFRHYEAPLCRSVPVINRAPRIRHRPFEEGVHCFYYDAERDDLATVVRRALVDRDQLRTMAAAGQEHVLRHHTFKAICRYVIETTLNAARSTERRL